MTTQTATRPNTHDMIVIHRVFRREMALLPRLIAAVPAGDVERAHQLSEHLRDYQAGLREHHTGEDELLWPLLLARVDLETDLVLRMEEQHQKVAANLELMDTLAGRWKAGAAADHRDQLVKALREHAVVLTEHLGDEEAMILPLAEEHLTADEWARLGERFTTHTPKDKLLYFLGAILEDATSEERAEILSKLPLRARIGWRLIGRRKYHRRVRMIRATG